MRELTTPISKVSARFQYISEGRYKLVLNAENGIDTEKSYYQYKVTNVPSGKYEIHKIKVSDLPVSFKLKIKEIHLMVVSHAESQGLLLPGDDVDDI